jgi:hypothetical protein
MLACCAYDGHHFRRLCACSVHYSERIIICGAWRAGLYSFRCLSAIPGSFYHQYKDTGLTINLQFIVILLRFIIYHTCVLCIRTRSAIRNKQNCSDLCNLCITNYRKFTPKINAKTITPRNRMYIRRTAAAVGTSVSKKG